MNASEQAFCRFLRGAVRVIGTQRAAAHRWRVSEAYLCDVLHGRRQPGPKLLKALGLRRHVTYHSREGRPNE